MSNNTFDNYRTASRDTHAYFNAVKLPNAGGIDPEIFTLANSLLFGEGREKT
jgi:hypothetical protein